MADDRIEQTLSAFLTALRAGESPDPKDYLAQVNEADQAELTALIELALIEGPGPEWDPEKFAASPVAAATERILANLGEPAPAVSWREFLVGLREQARVKRSELVSRLAQAIGFADQPDRVASYYHQLENAEIDPSNVSPTVWNALAEIVKADVSDFTEAIRNWVRPAESDELVAFARSPEVAAEIAAPAQADHAPTELDELDRLFLGEG